MALRAPLAAAGLAGLAWAVGLHGTDTAAQAYRVALFRHHGFALWDPGWYGGQYPLGYSVLTPPVAAVLGLGAMAVVGAGMATAGFDRLTHRLGRGRSAGVWWFAVSTLIAVGVGQLTYLCGEAVGLWALTSAVSPRRRRRPWVPLAGGVLTALFAPLAAAFVVLAAVVLAIRPARPRAPLIAVGAGAGAAVVVLGALFPGDGPMPFAWMGMVVVTAFCAAAAVGVFGGGRGLRWGAAAYGAATVACFLVGNPIGGNAARLAESVGLPVAAGAAAGAPSRRLLRVGALVPFVVWQWAPVAAFVVQGDQPAANTAAFYRPLDAQLAARSAGRPVRVEVVPTLDHWESVFVVRGAVTLARGWERQLDVARDGLFYRAGPLQAAAFRRWLLTDGVAWVALPVAPLDQAGRAEATLLRRGVPGLQLVWSSPAWRLWRVDGSPGLLSGPGSLAVLQPDRVVLDARRPGPELLRVRWTPYWTLSAGAACLTSAPGGWTGVDVRRPGPVRLGVSLIGSRSARCTER